MSFIRPGRMGGVFLGSSFGLGEWILWYMFATLLSIFEGNPRCISTPQRFSSLCITYNEAHSGIVRLRAGFAEHVSVEFCYSWLRRRPKVYIYVVESLILCCLASLSLAGLLLHSGILDFLLLTCPFRHPGLIYVVEFLEFLLLKCPFRTMPASPFWNS